MLRCNLCSDYMLYWNKYNICKNCLLYTFICGIEFTHTRAVVPAYMGSWSASPHNNLNSPSTQLPLVYFDIYLIAEENCFIEVFKIILFENSKEN